MGGNRHTGPSYGGREKRPGVLQVPGQQEGAWESLYSHFSPEEGEFRDPVIHTLPFTDKETEVQSGKVISRDLAEEKLSPRPRSLTSYLNSPSPLSSDFVFTILEGLASSQEEVLLKSTTLTLFWDLKKPPAKQETWVQALGWEDPLEKEMITHSRIVAWKIPWTEEPGLLQSTGSQNSPIRFSH